VVWISRNYRLKARASSPRGTQGVPS